jgi:5-bromo-4-chloroindolyl phosphate hydrolysis protein
MEKLSFLEIAFIAIVPVIISTVVTYLLNIHEIKKYKSDSMAERSAKYFLKHKGYTDRRFETIKKYLGGWDEEENELRKILVRAGAVRVFRDDEEWWYLLSRGDERIKKKQTKTKQEKI